MSALPDAEVRRLIKFLRGEIEDFEKLSVIEDELRGECGAEFLRESEIISYFQTEIFEILEPEMIWKLKIIAYTRLRMTQRGIDVKEIVTLFEKFLRYCADRNQIIAVGAYTIFGRAKTRNSPLTLRIDIDEIEERESKAHTVTIFIGRGNADQTVEINLIS